MIGILSALSSVAYEKLGAIFPFLVARKPAPTPAATPAKRSLIVPGWVIGGSLNLAFGMLFVAAYAWSPAVVPLFVVPLVAPVCVTLVGLPTASRVYAYSASVAPDLTV